jgi:regulator of chromosome condensation
MNGIEEERIERVLPNIYFWGSAECDQYDIKDEDGEDQPESERPYKLNYFATHQLNVVRIACGGLHSLFLTDLGKVPKFEPF